MAQDSFGLWIWMTRRQSSTSTGRTGNTLSTKEDIMSKIPSVLIGGDTILRENPPSFPVQDGNETREIPAVIVSVPLPTVS